MLNWFDNMVNVTYCCKRVMPECYFVLMRYGLRVDGVIYRIKDTRICHVYSEDCVKIEYRSQEGAFADVERIIKQNEELLGNLNNFNYVSMNIPITECETYKMNI
eukprot:TRINITY_DN6963_c0_g1_i3.p1 TRINITY_DN6963_c0_g1~~TRINITY_DN6963_c0_g1_i3.p1  ORF type:complete len:105 (-),score=10.38 TRINITY_DN6963_c0_g1_i3:29-343(-)